MNFFTFQIRRVFLFVFLLLAIAEKSNGQMRQIYYDTITTTYNNIQKISFYSPSQGYIASTDYSADWVGYSADSGRTITKRFITLGNVNFNGYNVNITFGFSIKGVKAFNLDTLIAYGDYGFVPAILYSTNGGLSYLLVYHSQFNPQQLSGPITDMVFPQNNNIGFAIDADRILKTTNKGLSWSVVRTDPDSFFDYLEAVDNNNVFVFSTGYQTSKLLKTSTAGSSWQQVSIPATTIYYSTFFTSGKGWLNVRDNNDSLRLYYTSNGGGSWVQKNNAEATPFFCLKMKFVNDSTGFSIGDYFTTYKTTDSGKVWQPLPRDNNFSYLGYYHNDILCLNENQIWCGGARDFLEISTNGGGPPIPKAFFKIDTTNSYVSNTINLFNYSKPGFQYKWFVNNIQVSTSYNTTYTHNILSQADSIVLIVTSGLLADTVKKYQYFAVPTLPLITSFSPTSGSTGTFVSINGSGFIGATSVKFGGVSAASFSVVSDILITATVNNGASGSVSVSNIHGTYSLPGFTYFPPSVTPPPVITTFSPASGPVGTSVTITGNNFASTASNNIVNFGAVKGVVTAASATQIICTVPAGSSFEPITILNANNNLTGRSFKPFNVTYADSSNFTTNSYLNVFTLSYIGSPKHVVGKDLDGDGKPDLTSIIGFMGDSIVAYRNTTDGTSISFGPRKNLGVIQSFSPGLFDINDIDGDGRPDIVGATNSPDVAVLRNLSSPGNLSFANQVSVLSSGSGNLDVVIADYDNDGKNDIAVAGFSNRTVSIIRNTSSPGFLSFAAPIGYSTVFFPVRIAAGDLDGDGKTDIVSYNYNGVNNTAFSGFRNTTAGGILSFAPAIDFAVPGSCVQSRTVMIADYDNDNKLDVIVANDNNYCIFRNISSIGNLAFAPVISVAINGGLQGACVSNLSGDMKPDIMTGNSAFRYFILIRNVSTPGSIMSDNPVNIQGGVTNTIPYYTNAADFNMDGKIDIISSSSQDKIIAIYKNNMGNTVLFSSSIICAGSTQQRPSDVLGNSYQWQQNTGSGFVNIADNSTFSGTQTSILTIANILLAWNGYLYRCIVNGNLYSSQFLLQVNTSLPPSITISTPITTVCGGVPVVFTAVGVNTSPVTQYNWQVNGMNVGTNSSTYTTSSLSNGSQVRCFLFNPCSSPNSAVSNVITMTVIGEIPSVSISTPSNTVCIGSSVVFTATPINPGASPSYQWQVNGINAGTNSNTFSTSSLTNGAQVRVIMTTAATACGTNPPVTSNTITMTVNNPVTPSVTISANSTTICQTATATFGTNPVNGGGFPSYQWQINNINVGTNSINNISFASSSLNNGDQVRVIMTSNASCITVPTATSNAITMTVINRVIPAVSISGTTIVFAGQSTTLNALGSNPGPGPVYQWQDSTAFHGWQNIIAQIFPVLNYLPAQTGDKVRCVLTSNATCALPPSATSNTLVFTVNTVTAINPVPGSNYGIRYYPSPVNSVLYIDSLKLSDKWQTLEIKSIDGKSVIPIINIVNRTTSSVNVERLAAGQYIVVLRRKNSISAYLKFIKQ